VNKLTIGVAPQLELQLIVMDDISFEGGQPVSQTEMTFNRIGK
jgi:hypothetical protein